MAGTLYNALFKKVVGDRTQYIGVQVFVSLPVYNEEPEVQKMMVSEDLDEVRGFLRVSADEVTDGAKCSAQLRQQFKDYSLKAEMEAVQKKFKEYAQKSGSSPKNDQNVAEPKRADPPATAGSKDPAQFNSTVKVELPRSSAPEPQTDGESPFGLPITDSPPNDITQISGNQETPNQIGAAGIGDAILQLINNIESFLEEKTSNKEVLYEKTETVLVPENPKPLSEKEKKALLKKIQDNIATSIFGSPLPRNSQKKAASAGKNAPRDDDSQWLSRKSLKEKEALLRNIQDILATSIFGKSVSQMQEDKKNQNELLETQSSLTQKPLQSYSFTRVTRGPNSNSTLTQSVDVSLSTFPNSSTAQLKASRESQTTSVKNAKNVRLPNPPQDPFAFPSLPADTYSMYPDVPLEEFPSVPFKSTFPQILTMPEMPRMP